MRIVCLGDSITAGQHLADGEPAWPALLSSGEVLARGVPGDTTRLGLERFPRDVQAAQPDVLVIQLGHNDANRWQTDLGLPRVSLPAFRANLHEMIDRAETFDIRPILCTITVSLRSRQHELDCSEYNVTLTEVALARGVRLANPRAVITGDHLRDGLHLNADGHRAYAAVVAEALR